MHSLCEYLLTAGVLQSQEEVSKARSWSGKAASMRRACARFVCPARADQPQRQVVQDRYDSWPVASVPQTAIFA